MRPYLQQNAADVELVRVDGTVAYVRMKGACEGNGATAQTLRRGVEEVVRTRVPEIARVQNMTETSLPGLIILEPAGASPADEGWVKGPAVAAVGEERPALAGDDAIVVRKGETLYAYRRACAHLGMPLDEGDVAGGVLTCPWHGYRYDVTSGECLTAPHVRLEELPLRVRDGYAWVRSG